MPGDAFRRKASPGPPSKGGDAPDRLERRRRTGETNAAIDTDAAGRGMGTSTWVTDAKQRQRAGEAADVLAPGEPSRPPVTSPVPDGGMAKTYFRRPVPEGRCGCVWPSRGLEMTMLWDSEKLPYLGFWITNGLWRGDRNFAFEPGSSYYDTLSRALESGTLRTLAPEESFTFSIRITVKETR